MDFVAGFDAALCQTLIDTSEEMLVKCVALIKDLRDKAPSTTVVAACKSFVALTRTLDTSLEQLAAQAPPGPKADGLNVSKSSSKKAVHSLLKIVKDAQTAGGLNEALSNEAEEASQALKRAFIKAKSILLVSEGGNRGPVAAVAASPGPADSPATQRFAALQKQVAAKKSAKSGVVATPGPVPSSSSPAPVASPAPAASPGARTLGASHDLGMSQNLVLDEDEAEHRHNTPAKRSNAFGAPPSQSPGLSRAIKSSPGLHRFSEGSRNSAQMTSVSLQRLGALDVDRSAKLLSQFDAKCRWLEDELYRSKEVHVILRVLQAQNLSPLDPNGKSDPYCVVPTYKTSNGNEIRTKVVPETLDPVWDESFEFGLPSRTWTIRVELLDYDSNSASKPLGFVELRASDWNVTTREQKKWLPVQGGSGTIYVGLKSAQHLGLARVEGDKYRCECCDQCDIPDLFECETCKKQTCALCIGLFVCDSCREDLCKRHKKAAAAEESDAAVSSPVNAAQETEYTAAQRLATLVDVSDWHNEHYQWQPWSAALGDKTTDPNLVVVPKSYGVEHGSANVPALTKAPLDLTMLDPFETYAHYTRHMIKTDHGIFIGSVAESSIPVLIVCEKLSYNSSGEQTLRALVYSPDGTMRQNLEVDCSDLDMAGAKKSSKSGSKVASPTPGDLRSYLLERFPGLSVQRVPVAAHADMAAKLLEYERNHTDIRRRVGVLFFPKGVREENAVFKSTGSPDLYEFMDMLAERVRLQGWQKYAGGLNTQNNSTGFESYYTEFLGFNMMFHVNSLLEDDGSEQQLSRKRFIGNDLVVIVFLEGEEPFDASMITSQMCHTFIVVKKIGTKPTRYRVSVVAKAGVPAFSPFLPFPNEFEKSEKLRQFLLAKALNGNRATFQAKTFLQKTKRTRKDLLARMLKDLTDDGVLTHSPAIVFNPESEPSPLQLCADNVTLKVHTPFIAEDATFLSLRVSDLVTAVTASPSEVYWTGILNGRVGRFPSGNVELAMLKQRSGLGALLKDKSGASKSSAALLGSPQHQHQQQGGVVFRIRFYQGKNMSVCDPWGTSDPYCTISALKDVNGKAIRTKVHQRTLNPEWNQAFEFNNTNPFTLRCEIWDKDLVGTDDSMGYVDINSKTWNLERVGVEEIKWLPVVDGDGEVQIGLTKVMESERSFGKSMSDLSGFTK
jgi:hypothetical protein